METIRASLTIVALKALILALLAAPLGVIARPDTAQAQGARPLPQSFAPLAARLRPAVVQIFALNNRGVSRGSGFIVDPSGWVVTNEHVIRGARQIAVRLTDGRVYEVRVRGRDRLTDLAVLKIDEVSGLPAVPWGDSDALEPGDWVLAIGNPAGLGGTVTVGIISATDRATRAGGPFDEYLQTDAAINAGNSGGPLFNLKGEVIGVNTAALERVQDRIFQGINFSRPSAIAEPVTDQIRQFGQSRRGWIGVIPQSMTPELAEAVGLPTVRGVLVNDLTPGGPAAVAGIRRGDVILSFNGQAVVDVRQFQRLVAETQSGAQVSAEIWRRGVGARNVVITMGRLNQTMAVLETARGAGNEADLHRTGMPSRTGGKSGTPGILVTRVEPESPLFGRLLPGDVLLEVDGTPVTDARRLGQLLKQVGNRSHVLARVRRATGLERPELVAIPID